MILAVHILTGAALAASSPIPAPGLIAAFASHFLLDSMPHHEYRIENLKARRMPYALNEALLVFLDLTAGFALVLLFARPDTIWLALAGGFLAILPDGISVLAALIRSNTLLTRFQALHDSFHYARALFTHKKALAGEIFLVCAALLLFFSIPIRP